MQATPDHLEPRPRRKPLGYALIAILVLAALFFGIRYYLYNTTHASTEDAFVSNDVIPISPQVPGSVLRVLVRENEEVRAGQVLAELDRASYRAEVDQAKASLEVAKANVRSATADVGLTSQAGEAQLVQARGGVAAGDTDIATAEADVEKARSGIDVATATYRSASAQARAAAENANSLKSTLERQTELLTGLRASLESARAAVRVSQANLANAVAITANARREAQRYRTLAEQGAVSLSQAEAKETASATAEAAEQAAREQISAAQALVSQRTAELAGAQLQLQETKAAITSARAQAAAAQQNAKAASSRVTQATLEVATAQKNVEAARARKQQVVGKLDEAMVLPKRISIMQAAKQTTLAKVRQAEAALESARLNLVRTRIVAPMAGRVSRKSVEIGQQVAAGQPLMSIIPTGQPWVVANFKETQVGDVRPGQTVDIEVDAFPGDEFRGRVESISAGTGATFALLPPDNATGNFTKVVQRVAVKIVFDPGQRNLERLAAGMSASVAIHLK